MKLIMHYDNVCSKEKNLYFNFINVVDTIDFLYNFVFPNNPGIKERFEKISRGKFIRRRKNSAIVLQSSLRLRSNSPAALMDR